MQSGSIGAEICVTVTTPRGERRIYKTVGPGGSFGCNPLRQEIGLGDAVLLGRGEAMTGGRQKPSILADTLEADWNSALRELAEATDTYERATAAAATLTETQRHRIAALAPLTLAYSKQVLNRLQEPEIHDPGLDSLFEEVWRSADVAEGQAARRERRPPRFEGR